MKALTVQQPWAWAIIHGGKSVENRSQAWSYRGPVAIHAGARWSERGAASPLIIEACRRAPSAPMNPGWVMGAVVGVVDLVDAHVAEPGAQFHGFEQPACCDSPWAESSYVEADSRRRRDDRCGCRSLRVAGSGCGTSTGALEHQVHDGEQLAQLIGTGAISGMECA